VGINFRDVLNVLGMYPGDPGAPGSDVAGLVVKAGPDSSLQPGQAVFGLAEGALGTAVSCSAQTVVAMPSCLSFEAASSMPTVFITAQMALGAVAAVEAGEAVLVHAAAGGVGLAALQVLQGKGARVVATAGSPAKRSLLRSLGVSAVVGSRDTEFASSLAVVGGVDVVLNSLTSPGMVAGSLSVVRQGGRFVEIGKRDIWAPAAVSADRPDVSYSLLAVDFLPDAVVHQALQQVAVGVATGELVPLPTVSHSLSHAAAALRQMSQARHIGKVVVSNAVASSPGYAAGRVLVTGGLGALGRLVAEWLSFCGAQQLHLLGRSGKLSGGGGSGSSHAALTQVLRCSQTSQVIVSQCDAGSSEDMAAVLGSSRLGWLPVDMVVHAGGVLADGVLQRQHLQGMRQVAAAKLPPAGWFRLLSQQQAVKSIVLFSSVASLLGSPGQANYAAVNAGLDAAAAAGQMCGVPAVSVQWGAWAGGGMAAADAQTAARVERMGMSLISPAAGLAALEAAMCSMSQQLSSVLQSPVIAAVPFDWKRFLGPQQPPHVTMLFQDFVEPVTAAAAVTPELSRATAEQQMFRRLPGQSVPPTTASLDVLQEQISDVVTAILGRHVEAEEPLVAAGFDSLGSVELRNTLQASLVTKEPSFLQLHITMC
jgi:NADPH:quinone reductase-like Zn-dependent oxidoreductase